MIKIVHMEKQPTTPLVTQTTKWLAPSQHSNAALSTTAQCQEEVESLHPLPK